jgi:8-oxo-dGTP pyrophosphatase MutT (NUDIX family)
MDILMAEDTAAHGKDVCYAVAAMLITEDGNYLLQQRDGTPGIWYPEMLCFFGGCLEVGEDAVAALRRELLEELEFCPPALTYYSFICYDTAHFGPGIGCRYVYESQITASDMEQMTQHEGAGMKLLSPEDVLNLKHPIAPVDLQILYVHLMCCGLVPQPAD